MKKISDDLVFSLHSLPDGFLYSHLIKQSEGKAKVGFKMVSFEKGVVTKVTKNIFMLAKFGANYKFFADKIKNYITCFGHPFDDGRTLVIETDGSGVVYDENGDELWSESFIYSDKTPTCAAVNDTTLWICYKELNTIVKYDLKMLRQELRIGGVNAPFKKPCGLFPAGTKLFVCSEENKSVLKLDCITYQTENYFEYEEVIKDYKFINKYEILVTESGIYML